MNTKQTETPPVRLMNGPTLALARELELRMNNAGHPVAAMNLRRTVNLHLDAVKAGGGGRP